MSDILWDENAQEAYDDGVKEGKAAMALDLATDVDLAIMRLVCEDTDQALDTLCRIQQALVRHREVSGELYCLVSDQGTAASETCLCSAHFHADHKREIKERAAKDVNKAAWHDCSENDACSCTVCGAQGR